jgi:hypothetical protein
MASLSAREPVKPCHAANQIESGGSREMLQMRSLQPNITRPAQTHHSNALGDGPLKADSSGINLGKFLGLFLLSPSHQGQILLLRANGHGTARVADRLRTERSRRAHLSVYGRELDLDDLVFAVVNGRRPTAAGVALRARCLLVLPIDEKVVDIEACVLTGLPLMVPAGWTHQVNLVVPLALDQELCVDIAGIDNVPSLARVPCDRARHEWLPSWHHQRPELMWFPHE